MSRDIALLILRLSGLGLALLHGWGKVIAAPGLFAWAAALAEFGGGLFVLLGLATRWAAASAGFTMLVAAFGQHKLHLHLAVALGLKSVSQETVKAWGNPEMAVVYLLPLVALALLGGGRFALDARLGRR